jgi:cytochrome oxidase assembly protein ShyY1
MLLAAVGVLAYFAALLGQWQFDRREQRIAANDRIARNLKADPVSATTLLTSGGSPEESEWRAVAATGSYAVEDTVVVRYRTRNRRPGVNVVVPLVLPDGTALAVDRGWMPTSNAGRLPSKVPQPPGGQVKIIGRVRADATGSAVVTEGSTRAISSVELSQALGREFLGGFVELTNESPAPEESLARAEPPDLGQGPHFFYGLQWWFFGLLAIGGFFTMAADEFRSRTRGGRRQALSTRSHSRSTH